MTDTQLFIAVAVLMVGLPVAGLLNASHLATMNGRLSAMDSQLASMNGRIDRLEASIESRLQAIETKFDILTRKVIEVANRLTRVEERLKH
jgi:septal ring factor EnvC (AmiA/AmiB activator)